MPGPIKKFETSDTVPYDNTTSGLTGDTVQEAIDELAASLGTVGGGKSRFTPFAANASVANGRHATNQIGANASGNFESFAPNDMTTFIAAYLICLPGATVTGADIDIQVDYCAVGETKTQHQGSDTTSTYNLTLDQMTALEFTSILGSLSAGDFIGVYVKNNSVSGGVGYLGVLFIYT